MRVECLGWAACAARRPLAQALDWVGPGRVHSAWRESPGSFVGVNVRQASLSAVVLAGGANSGRDAAAFMRPHWSMSVTLYLRSDICVGADIKGREEVRGEWRPQYQLTHTDRR